MPSWHAEGQVKLHCVCVCVCVCVREREREEEEEEQADLLLICLFNEIHNAGTALTKTQLMRDCFPLVLICNSVVSTQLMNNLKMWNMT